MEWSLYLNLLSFLVADILDLASASNSAAEQGQILSFASIWDLLLPCFGTDRLGRSSSTRLGGRRADLYRDEHPY